VELDLFGRARTWKQRQDKKQKKQDKKTAKAEQGKAKAHLEWETKAKVKFGKSAKEKLDELGLHGKERRQHQWFRVRAVYSVIARVPVNIPFPLWHTAAYFRTVPDRSVR
jgi:hypothetical protein